MLVQAFKLCQELNCWRNTESCETWAVLTKLKIMYELFLLSEHQRNHLLLPSPIKLNIPVSGIWHVFLLILHLFNYLF